MSNYWERRKKLRYYWVARDLVYHYVPWAHSILDVGGLTCEYLIEYDWIPEKWAIDLQPGSPMEGVHQIQGDFMTYEFERIFDVVLCLEVLEHLEDPVPFAQNLIGMGKIVVVSVPYKWPRGLCQPHVQDPVDEAKFRSWFDRDWLHLEIVHEKNDRMIAVFGGQYYLMEGNCGQG